MSTMCACGHDMERHNDISGADPIMTGWFGGNCRMCKCESFARVVKGATAFPVKMATCDKHSYIHITDWGCPFCYRAEFDKKKRKEKAHNDDVNDYDLRHLNGQIDSLRRSLGEILLLSQADIKNGKYEDMHPLNRLDCIEKEAKGALRL